MTDKDEENEPIIFDPRRAEREGQKRIVRWVSYDEATNNREDASTPEEVMADVEKVLEGGNGNLDALSFRDPETFKAGELRSHADLWGKILEGYKEKSQVLKWVQSGVDVEEFSQSFKGEYKGESYNSQLPPRRKFQNDKSCFCVSTNGKNFVTKTLLERLESGAVIVWGKVGKDKPPWLVLPMKVEPPKPRLVIDARFLNLWMKDNPKYFSLESLDVVPNFVYKDSFMTKIDDKSAYHHILLTRNSQKYFGIEWQGWWLVCTTLPFGWKNAPYVYQTVGLGATHFFRSRGIACSLYIDDRLNAELFAEEGHWSRPIAQRDPEFSSQAAKAALYVVCKVLVNLGYFLGLKKCVFEPLDRILYLGMEIDSTMQSFCVPEEKREKFAKLREEILESSSLQMPQLKKLRGKCLSFSKAFPLAKFYIKQMSEATDQPQARLSPITTSLRKELEFWRFHDDWKDVIPWTRDETIRATLSTSASRSPLLWTCTVHLPSGDRSVPLQREQPDSTNQAIKRILEELPSNLRNCEVNITVDSKEVRDEWEKGELTPVKKQILDICRNRNILVNVKMMDDPSSRGLRKSDSMLAPWYWNKVQSEFGGPRGHDLDLMSLDINCQKDRHEKYLRHFTPRPTENSSGVDVFSQDLSQCDGNHTNAYVFPPFAFIPKLLRYIMSQGAVVTMVVPKFSPLPSWWPIINSLAIKKERLAEGDERDVLLLPSQHGGFESCNSSEELWVFRVDGNRGKNNCSRNYRSKSRLKLRLFLST